MNPHGMLAALRQDYKRYRPGRGGIVALFILFLRHAGFRATALYRAGNWFRKRRLSIVAGLCERLIRHLCLCEIGSQAEIGPGLMIPHTIGLVIGRSTVIGSHCDLRQNTTLGANYGKEAPDGRTQPILGDNVSVGAGAVIIGPVRVGSNAVVGANAVVTHDVPDGATVAGVPARVIRGRLHTQLRQDD